MRAENKQIRSQEALNKALTVSALKESELHGASAKIVESRLAGAKNLEAVEKTKFGGVMPYVERVVGSIGAGTKAVGNLRRFQIRHAGVRTRSKPKTTMADYHRSLYTNNYPRQTVKYGGWND